MKDGIYQHKEYKDLFRKIINNKLSKIAYNIYEARDAEMTYCPANPSCWDYVATLEMGVEEAHTEFIKQWLTYGANPEMNKWDYEHPLFTYHYLALNRCFACLVTPLKDSSHLDCSKCPINWGAKNCEQGGTLYSKWKMAPIGSTIRSALAYQIAHIKWDYDNGLKDGIYKSTLATYYRKVKNGTIYWGEEEIELAKQTKDILFNKGEAKTEMNNFYWCCPLSKEFDINETEEVKYEPVSVGDRFKYKEYNNILSVVPSDIGKCRVAMISRDGTFYLGKAVEVNNIHRISFEEFEEIIENDFWKQIYKTRIPFRSE